MVRKQSKSFLSQHLKTIETIDAFLMFLFKNRQWSTAKPIRILQSHYCRERQERNQRWKVNLHFLSSVSIMWVNTLILIHTSHANICTLISFTWTIETVDEVNSNPKSGFVSSSATALMTKIDTLIVTSVIFSIVVLHVSIVSRIQLWFKFFVRSPFKSQNVSPKLFQSKLIFKLSYSEAFESLLMHFRQLVAKEFPFAIKVSLNHQRNKNASLSDYSVSKNTNCKSMSKVRLNWLWNRNES